MIDNNTYIIERIKNQKEALTNWDTELKIELSQNQKNLTRKIKFYIVRTDWLKNYVQIFIKGQKDYNNLIYSYYNFNFINNDFFSKATSFKEFSKSLSFK